MNRTCTTLPRRLWALVPGAALIASSVLLLAACGGSDDLPSRQDFVDNIQQQGGELLDENISSCMYDGLEDDDAARQAVSRWEEGEAVPEELLDLAVACLRDVPDTPGT
jgi:hypothetical protein